MLGMAKRFATIIKEKNDEMLTQLGEAEEEVHQEMQRYN
jgi:hypothetical protein